MDFLPLPKLIQLELESCYTNCYKNILIQPSIRNLKQWQVYLFPTSGVFKSFTLTFYISFDNYPRSPPLVTFQSGLIHPYIDPSSKFDVKLLFNGWNPQIRVYSVLNSIYDSFIEVPIPQGNCPNMEAVKYLKQGTEAYSKKALDQLPKIKIDDNRELNEPKKWNPFKEKLVISLYQTKPQ